MQPQHELLVQPSPARIRPSSVPLHRPAQRRAPAPARAQPPLPPPARAWQLRRRQRTLPRAPWQPAAASSPLLPRDLARHPGKIAAACCDGQAGVVTSAGERRWAKADARPQARWKQPKQTSIPRQRLLLGAPAARGIAVPDLHSVAQAAAACSEVASTESALPARPTAAMTALS